MRSRHRGWIMPEEDIPSMLQMIEEKIASSEIEVEHRHAPIRLRDILEGDLHRISAQADRDPIEESSQEAAQTRNTHLQCDCLCLIICCSSIIR